MPTWKRLEAASIHTFLEHPPPDSEIRQRETGACRWDLFGQKALDKIILSLLCEEMCSRRTCELVEAVMREVQSHLKQPWFFAQMEVRNEFTNAPRNDLLVG